MMDRVKEWAAFSAHGHTSRDENGDEKTDYSRWRILDDEGRQEWRYLETDHELEKWPQHVYDKHYLGLDTGLPDFSKIQTPLEAAQAASSYLSQLQLPSGSWGSESAGPLMLLPCAIIGLYVTNSPIPPAYAVEIKRYLFSHQRSDGGWGWHVEGESSAVGTVFNYTVARLLGASPDDPRLVRARALLHSFGGATHVPGIAKFWLSALGVMEWECVNPFLPEFWLAPESDPTHPSKWYIQTRTNLASLSYVWSKKFVYAGDATTKQLRSELYTQQPYESINFAAHRTSLAEVDNIWPKWWFVRMMNWVTVNVYIPYIRGGDTVAKAEKKAWEMLEYEDKNSEYIGLSVISNAANLVACMIHDGEDSEGVKMHRKVLLRHFWMTADGMACNVSDGTQSWDTSLAVQALAAAGAVEQAVHQPTLVRAHAFLEDHQLRENVPDQDKCYRQHRKGGWPWSTRHQGYVISECAAEGLKAVLDLQEVYRLNLDISPSERSTKLSTERLQDCVDCLLRLQNDTGGFGIWDKRKGSHKLSWLEMGEFAGKSMVTLDFVECTAEAISAIACFAKYHPEYRPDEVKEARDRGIAFIKQSQHSSGGWYAQWGICFSYGGMFALEALALAGETYSNSESSRRGCDFLVSKQKEDGGWGESFLSLRENDWIQHEKSQVIQTAWVCLGLIHAKYPNKETIKRGIQLIMSRQQSKGQWLQEQPEGGIEYGVMTFANYKLFWPLRALGEYVRIYGDEEQ